MARFKMRRNYLKGVKDVLRAEHAEQRAGGDSGAEAAAVRRRTAAMLRRAAAAGDVDEIDRLGVGELELAAGGAVQERPAPVVVEVGRCAEGAGQAATAVALTLLSEARGGKMQGSEMQAEGAVREHSAFFPTS